MDHAPANDPPHPQPGPVWLTQADSVWLEASRDPETNIIRFSDPEYDHLSRLPDRLHLGHFRPIPGAFNFGDGVSGSFRHPNGVIETGVGQLEAVLEGLQNRRQSGLRSVIGGRSQSAGSSTRRDSTWTAVANTSRAPS
jgi:hypothetical protein